MMIKEILKLMTDRDYAIKSIQNYLPDKQNILGLSWKLQSNDILIFKNFDDKLPEAVFAKSGNIGRTG